MPLIRAAWGRKTIVRVLTLAILGFGIFVLPMILRLMPSPIGEAAEAFSKGTRTTAELTLAAGSAGLVLGTLIGLFKMSPVRVARWPAATFIWIVRGTPLLVQILFVYLALPALVPGLKLNEFASAAVALSLNVAAYNAEAIRAGVLAIPIGQTQAARALGLSGIQTLWWVVLPQAFRIALPSLVNNLVGLLKDSSLAYAIGVVELSMIGQRVQSESFQPIPVFLTVAGVYLFLTTTMTMLASTLEAEPHHA